MIPTKKDREYIQLHYKLLEAYRKKNKYKSFRHINKKIKRKWQIMNYYKSQTDDNKQITPKLKWSDTIEQVQYF